MCEKIKYISTNRSDIECSFQEALFKGLAFDRGLFMPSVIPKFSLDELKKFYSKTYEDIAIEVMYKFLKKSINKNQLKDLIYGLYDFDIPIERVFEKRYIIRLDQGPSGSFKDFGAKMMSRLMSFFLKKDKRKITILTATSGDTGSAIAHAFNGMENIKLVILYPKNEVTDIQRKQMTTFGDNVKAIGLNAKFDDCQYLVKKAFNDKDLVDLNLSSANSINIGRLIPQSIYYFYSYFCITKDFDSEIIFSIPSGNLGNLVGGLFAKNMGLPIKKFIIATNQNDSVLKYFKTKKYKAIIPSKKCISNAMNVGHPSNLARLIHLYGGQIDELGNNIKDPDFELLLSDLDAIAIDDEVTKKTIEECYFKYKIILEPHGSVGWSALDNYQKKYGYDDLGVVLETAHPSKFENEIKHLIHKKIDLHYNFKNLNNKKEYIYNLDNDYKLFKDFLLSFGD